MQPRDFSGDKRRAKNKGDWKSHICRLSLIPMLYTNFIVACDDEAFLIELHALMPISQSFSSHANPLLHVLWMPLNHSLRLHWPECNHFGKGCEIWPHPQDVMITVFAPPYFRMWSNLMRLDHILKTWWLLNLRLQTFKIDWFEMASRHDLYEEKNLSSKLCTRQECQILHSSSGRAAVASVLELSAFSLDWLCSTFVPQRNKTVIIRHFHTPRLAIF